jgi:hypothetical protein
MHRTARDNAGAAARDPAATVAPLLRLHEGASAAMCMARHARAEELYARTVAAAEATLPGAGTSLVVLGLLRDQLTAHFAAAGLHAEQGVVREERMTAVAQAAESRAVLARACDIARARWRAGTLFHPSPEEEAFYPGSNVLQTGIIALLELKALVLMLHPAPDDPDALCAVLDALRAALEADARGLLGLLPPLQQPQSQPAALAAVTSEIDPESNTAARNGLQRLLQYALGDGGRLIKLRTLHGLSFADEAALRALRQRVAASFETETDPDCFVHTAAMRQRAAADVARHGLRACALPECAAKEPHPKAFKLCGRCRGVVYCSAAHQAEDWRRHKRDDGCKAAA